MIELDLGSLPEIVLLDELASRHKEFLVIRPVASNRTDLTRRLSIYCKTPHGEAGFDLFEATEMLQAAQLGLLHDCIEPIE